MSLPGYLSIGLLGCLLMGGVHAQWCPTDPLYYDGKIYCYIPEELSWNDAVERCGWNWGQLARTDCELVPREISEYLTSHSNKDVWIIRAPDPTGRHARATDRVCLALDRDTGFRICDSHPCRIRLPLLCERPDPNP